MSTPARRRSWVKTRDEMNFFAFSFSGSERDVLPQNARVDTSSHKKNVIIELLNRFAYQANYYQSKFIAR